MIQIGERWRVVQNGVWWEAQEWDDVDGWVARWWYSDVGTTAYRLGQYIGMHGCGHDLAALQTALGAIHAEIAQALERAREEA